ncbi:hypothetical protein FB480_1012 [Agrobacterium vitis]|nr:hypothetical protein FB480_1012 [Agrobacterium vitis]
MSTADKTTNNNANVVGNSLRTRLVTGYRWAFSVFSRRHFSNVSNDLKELNAHQLRDLGMDAHLNDVTSCHDTLEHAKLKALLLLMGVNGR